MPPSEIAWYFYFSQKFRDRTQGACGLVNGSAGAMRTGLIRGMWDIYTCSKLTVVAVGCIFIIALTRIL
ncbi:MAG: hypothetical protein QG603_492 [Patescibacteria group bacterium]|nr:hypothetical protein [Patescibacteria group bacterium]MDQ5970715.1 hypothetical protein [Patescibacteria group bacterium]